MKYGVNRQILLITAGTVWIIAGANILRIGIVTWLNTSKDWMFKIGEATYSNSQRNHEDHCNPAFHIEKGERAIFVFFLLFDSLGMFIIKPSEHQNEE